MLDEPGCATLRELYHQAEAARLTVARASERARALESLRPLSSYTDILFAGCGSSYHLAQCAAAAWSKIFQRPCRSVPSAELYRYGESYLDRGARPLLVAISRTGGTDETILAAQSVSDRRAVKRLAVTTVAGSPLGQVCDVELSYTECAEESVVTTQAFTCMLLGLLLVGGEWSGSVDPAALDRLLTALSQAISDSDGIDRRLGEDRSLERFVFLGSGPLWGLASEAALKMTEMALSLAQSFPVLEYRHGPKAILDERTLVTMFLSRAEAPYLNVVCEEILITGARILMVGQELAAPALSGGRVHALVLGAGVDERYQPVLFAHVAQQLAFWRSRSLGLNPDAPPHLVKTVRLE